MGDFYNFVARDEVLDLFRRLVQTDTSNPPGHEETAAHLLHSVLKDSGLELVLDRFAPLRANLTAIWKRKGSSAALLLSGTWIPFRQTQPHGSSRLMPPLSKKDGCMAVVRWI